MKKLSVKFIGMMMLVSLPMFMMQSCSEDPCEGETCSNQGTPTEDGDNCTCVCDSGYEGIACADEVRDKFEGNYTWTDACSPGVSYTSTIGESATDVLKVTISNILGTLEGTAIATVDGNTITIASQSVTDKDGDAWTVQSVGSGTIASGAFTLTVQATFGTNTVTCVYSYTQI